jgi:hypothetical protein
MLEMIKHPAKLVISGPIGSIGIIHTRNHKKTDYKIATLPKESMGLST